MENARSRAVYRRVASRIASQVADCLRAGIEVVAVVAVDGSPSCGLRRTMDLRTSMEALGRMNPDGVTVAGQNELVRRHQRDGKGLFIDELERALARRGLDVSFLAHDLIAELDGRRVELRLPD